MNDFVRVVLPKSYDLVVGDTFQLFYRGIIEAVNPYCYDILALCEKGSNFPRYFEFTPEEEGEHHLTVNVYANDKTLLASGQTMLKVHAAKGSPKQPVNILCVGDSLTSNGMWVAEAHRRLTAAGGEPKGHGLSGFRFIGTCTKDAVGYEEPPFVKVGMFLPFLSTINISFTSGISFVIFSVYMDPMDIYPSTFIPYLCAIPVNSLVRSISSYSN